MYAAIELSWTPSLGGFSVHLDPTDCSSVASVPCFMARNLQYDTIKAKERTACLSLGIVP